MLPGIKNLTLYRGDTRVIPIVFETQVDEVTTAPVNLTGLTWKAQVREEHDASSVAANFTIEVVDAAAGSIEVIMESSEAKKLPPTGVWDLESLSGDGFRQTWVYGNIITLPDTTRTVE